MGPENWGAFFWRVILRGSIFRGVFFEGAFFRTPVSCEFFVLFFEYETITIVQYSNFIPVKIREKEV